MTASIHDYKAAYRQDFCDMMVDYFKNDILEEYSPEQMAIVVARVEYEMRIYPLYIHVLECGGSPAGFCIFQVDTPDNPWGLRPGWGFIREMYVEPRFRGKGYGRLLYNSMTGLYMANSVTRLYLTAESPEALGFWSAMGFVATGVIHTKNDLEIFQNFLDS